jgi:hypothetical protein
MPQESWESYIDGGPDFSLDENSLRLHGHGDDLWQVEEEGSFRHHYSMIRLSEVEKRNQEIFRRIKHFYLSRNVLAVVVTSLVLGVITSTLSVEGLLFWNILLAVVIVAFFEMTVKKKVRPEWREIWDEIENI